MTKVLIVGLGIITKGIIENLSKERNFELILYSRHYMKVNTSYTFEIINNLNDTCDHKDISIILTCFKDDLDAEEFLKTVHLDKLLLNKPLFVDMTTSKISSIKERKNLVESNGGYYVECPITGSKQGSEQGDLSLFVSHSVTSKAALEILNTFFSCIARNIYYFSESTAPTKFKLLYNGWGAAILLTLKYFNPEHYNFALNDANVIREIITTDGWMSGVASSKFEQINSEAFDDVNFKLESMIKDLEYAFESIHEFRNCSYFEMVRKNYTSIPSTFLKKDFSIIGMRDDN